MIVMFPSISVCAMVLLVLLLGPQGSGIRSSQAQTTMPALAVSPFGIGPSASNGKDLTTWIPRIAELGIGELRTCHMHWRSVEPTDGVWTWDHLDEQLNYLEKHKVRTGCMLIGRNARCRTKGLPTDVLPDWSRYVSQIVAHTKGRVRHFEVWNEPPNATNNAPAADYAKVVIAAYNAAKAANPDCQVGLAAKSVHVNYLEQTIQAGAKDHFDYITLHPYEVLGVAADVPGAEAIYMSIVPTVRKMLAAKNPAKANVPIWFTEIGTSAKRGEDRQARALVMAYVMGIAQGVTCIQWFEGRDGDSGPMGLLDAEGKPRPSFTALQQLISRLGTHPTYLGWVLLNGKHYGFVFKGAKGPVMAAWAGTAEPETISFGAPVQITDPVTARQTSSQSYDLGRMPILVEDVPGDLVKAALANKDKAFPWGGDYTNATSVSLTLGERKIEKGLHSKSAESVAADVVAYGGNARAGNVPGGSIFTVDPNFLSYTTTPIDISIVVRRNEVNDPASITLEYESTDGFKKLQPFNIPDNKQWHTASWKIDDAQFVNMWGYNFRINEGKYVIQRVTVTKLDGRQTEIEK